MRAVAQRRRLPQLGATLLVVALAASACSSGKKNQDRNPTDTTVAPAKPGVSVGGGEAVSGTIPPPKDNEVALGEDPERLDGVTTGSEGGDAFDDNISPVAVRDPNATADDELPPIPLPPPGPDGKIPTTVPFSKTTTFVPLPTLGTSPAEREALLIPTTSRVGSLDNDASAAAGDTRVPVLNTLAPVPTQPTTTFPPRTVPDLGLDPAAAERLIAKAAWPAGLTVQPGGDIKVAGNAFASIFAEDRALRRALRSGSSRLLSEPVGEGLAVYVAGVVVIDPAALGSSVTDAIVRSVSSEGSARVATFDGRPSVVIDRKDGVREYVVVVGDRLVAAGAGVQSDPKLQQVLTALIRAASS